jgi:hypothetical protein
MKTQNDYEWHDIDRCPKCGLHPTYYKYINQSEVPDPSLEPMVFDGKLWGRYRYIADFDGDGLDDIALMNEPDPLGYTGNLPFDLYLQTTNGFYRKAGEIGIYRPDIDYLAIEHYHPRFLPRTARIWTFGKYGMNFREIKNGIISFGFGMNYFYDPEDDDSLILPVSFNDFKRPPMRLEYSDSTNELGQAVWVLVDEYISEGYITPKIKAENSGIYD